MAHSDFIQTHLNGTDTTSTQAHLPIHLITLTEITAKSDDNSKVKKDSKKVNEFFTHLIAVRAVALAKVYSGRRSGFEMNNEMWG